MPSNKTEKSSKQGKHFPIVGLGASAGGLEALKTFFDLMPADSGLAFVVIMHLSPDHESHLAQLLQPYVRMPVKQVTRTVKLNPDCVYVIPPNANLNAVDSHLRLSKLEDRRRERAPIDHFFRTLTKTHDGDAIGIILTGTGSDGTVGLKEIKEKGGLTIVQDPNDAEFDGMPLSALSNGIVDLILPLQKIPNAILEYVRFTPHFPSLDANDANEKGLQLTHKILSLLKTRTGRDFERYKFTTLGRRIQRRMQLRQIKELADYLKLLRSEAEEIQTLADDLLITVTNFFRDPKVFEKLADTVIPRLFEENSGSGDIRVWSVACATGEEAYSLTMLLVEEAERRNSSRRLQIFASDLHEPSLRRAREGFYPGEITSDVSPARLKKFFIQEEGGYRVRKELRERVVFTPHNLLSDPPFSRIDLLVCRNMLIYLQRNTQSEVLELFHYILRPKGHLVLGSSETVDSTELFQTVDKSLCLFRKRDTPAREPSLPVFPVSRTHFSSEREDYGKRWVSPGSLHQRMVELYAAPSALINQDDRLIHLSEHAGRYFHHPGGELTANVYKLLKESLRTALGEVIKNARVKNLPQSSSPIIFREDGKASPVTMRVQPVLEPDREGYVLVIFEETHGPASKKTDKPETTAVTSNSQYIDKNSEIAHLRELQLELQQAEERHHALIAKYETGREEMRASNEEMQSTNEELRSTLEELETSKEELQSINEELHTVNQENHHKMEELAQLTSDMQNLFAATEIATLFLNRELVIMRFTPKIGELFNIRQADCGRPISDLTHSLGYDELQSDAQKVLKSLIPVEREILSISGNWYLTRVIPYRSSSDRIEGVVLTFVDISSLKTSEKALRKSKAYAEHIIMAMPNPFMVLAPDLTVLSANATFYEHFLFKPVNTEGKSIYTLNDGEWNTPSLQNLLEKELPARQVSGYRTELKIGEQAARMFLINARLLQEEEIVLLGFQDITEQYQVEQKIRKNEKRLTEDLFMMTRLHELVASLLESPDLTTALNNILEGAINIIDADMGYVQLFDPGTGRLTIVSNQGLNDDLLERWSSVLLKEDSKMTESADNGRRLVAAKVSPDENSDHRKFMNAAGCNGLQATPLYSRRGDLLGMLTTLFRENYEPSDRDIKILDLYARQAAEFIEHVRTQESLKLESERKDVFLATLAHELRNPLAPISTGLELLIRADDKLAIYDEVVAMMKNQTNHLICLVNDLLDVSRITRGKLQLRWTFVKLEEVISIAVEETRHVVERYGHTLELVMPSDQVSLHADRHRLAQIISNLISNAAKYTPEKGHIRLLAEQQEDRIVIEVSDNGIGIDGDKLGQIFEIFSQLEQPREKISEGLGIGLTIVKSLVELHHGEISVDSEGNNLGSVFKVRLPVEQAVNVTQELSTLLPHLTEVVEKSFRILIVDDNEAAARTLGLLLEMLGHEIHIETNGEAGLEATRTFTPDIILMDIGMPNMDGYEATRLIRKQPWGSPIVIAALTGWGRAEDRIKTRDAGFDFHLVKPVEAENLKAFLRSVQDGSLRRED